MVKYEFQDFYLTVNNEGYHFDKFIKRVKETREAQLLCCEESGKERSKLHWHMRIRLRATRDALNYDLKRCKRDGVKLTNQAHVKAYDLDKLESNYAYLCKGDSKNELPVILYNDFDLSQDEIVQYHDKYYEVNETLRKKKTPTQYWEKILSDYQDYIKDRSEIRKSDIVDYIIDVTAKVYKRLYQAHQMESLYYLLERETLLQSKGDVELKDTLGDRFRSLIMGPSNDCVFYLGDPDPDL